MKKLFRYNYKVVNADFLQDYEIKLKLETFKIVKKTEKGAFIQAEQMEITHKFKNDFYKICAENNIKL